MSKSRVFRPVVGEILEDRAVPSGLGGLLGNLIGSVPAQDARQVSKAFGMFEQTYFQDVRTVLLPSGTTNPSANRPAFDSAVATALGTLNSSIDAAIKNLPTASSLDATIQGELLGSGSTTLQTELASIPSPTSASFFGARMFVFSSFSDIGQTAGQVIQQVRSAPAPSGSISIQTVQQDLQQVGTAFQTFLQAYSSDVKSILLPPGTTNPSANRTQFDQAVATALTTLNSSVASALSNLPASVATSLATTIQTDLLRGSSTTGTSLQARLAALKSPASASGFSVLVFRFESFLNIELAEGKVVNDILAAVRQFNSSI